VARTDQVSRVIKAPLAEVFSAFLDRTSLESWLAPDGMTARFERSEPRPGGSYRLILTYPDSTHAAKSSADSDIVEGRYVNIVHNDRVVHAVDFDSDDRAFAGSMTMTWAVQAVDDATRVEFTATDVPAGISAEDHRAGMTSSLEHLASYLET
jgi:uncharacterized protein YndB with AHSA1/START domain